MSRVTFRRAKEHPLDASFSQADGESAVFDDPNVVSGAGLAPVVSLAHRAWLADLVRETLTLAGEGAANVPGKVPALVAGIVTGTHSTN